MNKSSSTLPSGPTVLPWPPILLVLTGVGAWLLERTYPLPWPGTDDGMARTIGLSFGLFGVALLFWSLNAFRRHKTTLLPNKVATNLITDGPYWRFRNPIYLSEVLIFLGLAEVTKNVWFVLAAAIFAVLVTQLAILPEERHLEDQFGDTYRDYKSRTRRWI